MFFYVADLTSGSHVSGPQRRILPQKVTFLQIPSFFAQLDFVTNPFSKVESNRCGNISIRDPPSSVGHLRMQSDEIMMTGQIEGVRSGLLAPG